MIIHQPHDKLFKQSMRELRVAREFLLHHVPSNIIKIVDLKTLELVSGSFIDANFKASEADIIYQAKMNGRFGYFYTLCEHQSEIDKIMPLRLLGYILRLLEKHARKFPDSSLPIVYPLVVYTGDAVWSGPLDVWSLFGEECGLVKNILWGPYQLIDVQREPDAELRKRKWSGLVEFVLKYNKFQDIASVVEPLFPWLDEIDRIDGTELAKIVIQYILRGVNEEDGLWFSQQAEQALKSNKLRGEVMTYGEYLQQQGRLEGLEKGRQEGRQEGRREGRQQAAKQIAVRLLQRGQSVEAVVELTGLSLADVLEVKTKLQH